MSSKRNQLDCEIRNCRSELERNCPAVLLHSVRSKIQELNSKLFHYLTETKTIKFHNLAGPDSVIEPPQKPRNTVVTIPDDLPLTDAEKSILGKGLNFVPLQKKSDEFSARLDTEQFLRRVQLKSHCL